MDVDDDDEPTASAATGSASTTVLPPEVQAKSAIPSTANTFPTAEGVKWDTMEDHRWGTQVWKTKDEDPEWQGRVSRSSRRSLTSRNYDHAGLMTWSTG